MHGNRKPVLTPHVDGVSPDGVPLSELPFTILTPGIFRFLFEGGNLVMSEDSASRINGSAVDRLCPLSSLVRSALPEIDLDP